MMSKEQALHKAERHLSQLVNLVERSVKAGVPTTLNASRSPSCWRWDSTC